MPISKQYNDIYYSDSDAIGESEYVFLQNNFLQERWSKLEQQHFQIAEIGFGSGLNFLCSWKLWDDCAKPGSALHYIAIENHPFLLKDIRRLHKLWPELSSYSNNLLSKYRDHSPGFHRFHFGDKNRPVILDLLYGDAKTLLKSMPRKSHNGIDAWFLDGFSPQKNPLLWSLELFKAVASHSKPGCTLSTYTAVGEIRRNLEKVGFAIEKKPGYGVKRHMLAGIFNEKTTPVLENKSAWFILPNLTETQKKQVIVLGAGIAGCATAYALAKKGLQVILIERENNIAQLASGNSQAILHCKLSTRLIAATQFALQAYLYASDLYNSLHNSTEVDFKWQQTGLIQLASDKSQLERIQSILNNKHYSQQILSAMTAKQASQKSKIELTFSGAYLPYSGWLDPRKLCKAFSQHPNIKILLNTQALEIKHTNDAWHLFAKSSGLVSPQDSNLISSADAVVIANSMDAFQFKQSQHYPLIPNRGQVSQYSSTPNCNKLKTVVCSKGYIIPALKGHHTIGGSYTPDCLDNSIHDADKQKNLDILKTISQGIYKEFIAQGSVRERAAIRCSTPDYMPIIGPVEKLKESRIQYSELSLNAKAKIGTPGIYEKNLYINIAHGSHAITTAPLAAEYLASLICGESLPLQEELINCIHPVRFLIRELRKQKKIITKEFYDV